MIDLIGQRIHLGGNSVPIEKWEVWFSTPFGLLESLHEANQRCAAAGFDANLVVVPVTVAVGPERDLAGFRQYEVVQRM